MRQAEKIFMISDASKQVEVEAHVLRYWEDELKLPVKRNEMGHRYYTEEDIKLFQRIKEWKEQGLQLKAIRNMLKSGSLKEPMVMFGMNMQRQEESTYIEDKKGPDEISVEESENADLARRHVIMVKKGEVLQSSVTTLQDETREQKSLRLQQLLSEMIAQAMQSNNRELCQEIKESLLKELDYQFRIQEEREDERELQRINRQEEHYRQIDELIRSHNPKGKDDINKKERKQKIKEEKMVQKQEEKEKKQKEKENSLNRNEKRNKETEKASEKVLEELQEEKMQQKREVKHIFLKRKRSIV